MVVLPEISCKCVGQLTIRFWPVDDVRVLFNVTFSWFVFFFTPWKGQSLNSNGSASKAMIETNIFAIDVSDIILCHFTKLLEFYETILIIFN